MRFLFTGLVFGVSWVWLTHNGQAQEQDKHVVATIKPLHSLVQAVMGDTGRALLMVDGKTSPHNFVLKASHLRMIENAAIVFYIDDGFEFFLERAFKRIEPDRRVPIAQAADIRLLAYEGDHHDHDHGHDHDGTDKHIWLDTDNALEMVIAIEDALAETYPEYKETYRQNANALRRRIVRLDDLIEERLDSVRDEPFMVFHDAYGYFARQYDLNYEGAVVGGEGGDLSPGMVTELRSRIRSKGVVCVFAEPQFSRRFLTVIDDLGVKYGVLDPLGAEQQEGPKLYFTLMLNLATSLQKCLQQG